MMHDTEREHLFGLHRLSVGMGLLMLAWLFVSTGCSSPPLVQDAGRTGPSVLDHEPGAVQVAVVASRNVTLRGVFVPADASERVILHLLPSGASVRTGVPAGIGRVGLAPMVAAFRRLGWSSLMLDYRGVGFSEGSLNTDLFLEDGRRMWQEAVRRAGGNERNVVIRAGSIGSLIVADLLSGGAQPGGVVLYAPVQASTIVGHAATAHHGWLHALLSRILYRSPSAPDLTDLVGVHSVPMLLVFPESDAYLSRNEAIEIACAAVGSSWAVQHERGDHHATILQSWGFALDTDSFSGRQTLALPAYESTFLAALVFD